MEEGTIWHKEKKEKAVFFMSQIEISSLGINITVTLPKPTVGRRSASKILENRATLADCRPTSAPILADFLVGRRLFCRSTQVKSFVDRSADLQGFCHRWSVGRWSPDNRPTVGRRFEEIFIIISAKSRPIIGRQSTDDRQTVGRCHFIKELSADRRRRSAVNRPTVARLSAVHKMWFVFYSLIMHVSELFIYEIKSCIYVILGFFRWTLWIYHLFLAHLSRRLKWAIVIAHRPSVRPSSVVVVVCKLSHFQLLLQNRLIDFDETW